MFLVSPRPNMSCRAFKGLEPDAGKLACPVLRGGSGGNSTPLLDQLSAVGGMRRS